MKENALYQALKIILASAIFNCNELSVLQDLIFQKYGNSPKNCYFEGILTFLEEYPHFG